MDVPLACSEGEPVLFSHVTDLQEEEIAPILCSRGCTARSLAPLQGITRPQSAGDWITVNSQSLILTGHYPDLRDRAFLLGCSWGLSTTNLHLDTRQDLPPPSERV